MRTLVMAGGLAVGGGLLFLQATACQNAALLAPDTAQARHVEPLFVPGNPTCGDLIPDACELKIEPVADGTYAISSSDPDCAGLTGTVSIDVDGRLFDWEVASGNIVIEGVVVKGGPNANFYDYRPGGATEDDGLHAPVNPSNGNFYGLSHISFCAAEAPETGALVIQKTAKHAAAVGGAQAQSGVAFDIYDKDGNLVTTVVTEANGEVCVDDLLVDAGPYSVVEQPVPGYQTIGGQSGVSLEGFEDTTCENIVGAKTVEFVNTPLSNIHVQFESQVEGGTIARIRCTDELGNPLPTTDPTDDDALDDTSESSLDLPPGTYDCEIFIDP